MDLMWTVAAVRWATMPDPVVAAVRHGDQFPLAVADKPATSEEV